MTLLVGLIACENQDKDFPDYIFTSGYFPYQYPVRTIVLGDYIYDNTNDNNHKFLISVAIGGIYENTKDRVFNVELAPSLCTKVLFGTGKDTIRLMPSSYYTLSSPNTITVPKGEFNGGVEVTLTDAFFNDTKSVINTYVIPMRIVNSADVDTVLRGKSFKTNPDPRYTGPGEWEIVPKDFTMFAVKYINKYHGKYLHRGANTVKNSSGTTLETNIYRQKYNVDDEIWSLVTTSLNKITLSGGTHSTLVPGTLKMDLTFADNGDCTITQAAGSTYTITGSGKFKTGADSWGNKPRDAIHMTYQLTSGAYSYSATDTLVIRDRAVVMEVYTPFVIK